MTLERNIFKKLLISSFFFVVYFLFRFCFFFFSSDLQFLTSKTFLPVCKSKNFCRKTCFFQFEPGTIFLGV